MKEKDPMSSLLSPFSHLSRVVAISIPCLLTLSLFCQKLVELFSQTRSDGFIGHVLAGTSGSSGSVHGRPNGLRSQLSVRRWTQWHVPQVDAGTIHR
eukprot:scaffold34638_cov161-Amphora_coffeaeformis.AAC.1